MHAQQLQQRPNTLRIASDGCRRLAKARCTTGQIERLRIRVGIDQQLCIAPLPRLFSGMLEEFAGHPGYSQPII